MSLLLLNTTQIQKCIVYTNFNFLLIVDMQCPGLERWVRIFKEQCDLSQSLSWLSKLSYKVHRSVRVYN